MEMKENLLLVKEMLSEIVRQDLGQEVAAKIEAIRRLADEDIKQGTVPSAQLLQAISMLSDEELLHVARVFNQSLNLINTTEQLAQISDRAMGRYNPIQFADLCKKLKSEGISNESIIATLEQLTIDMVLTAHPTEINRRSLINNLNETSDCLDELDRNDLPDYKRAQLMRRLKQLIAQYWHTDEIRKYRPTPEEEAKWGNDVIETSLWYAVPEFIRELNIQLEAMLDGYTLPLHARPIQLTAWMGGDRDGNPNVTANVTRQVLLQNRRRAAKLFLLDIEALVKELSMSRCTEEFRAYLQDEQVQEPYRALMKRLRTQLHKTIDYIDERLAGGNSAVPEDVIWHNDQL